MNAQQAIEILAENIRILSVREQNEHRKRTLCTEQLIDRLLAESDGESSEAVLSAFRRTLSECKPEDCARLLTAMAQQPTRFPDCNPKRRFGEATADAKEGAEAIALVRNPYTEQAYRCFSKIIAKPELYHASSFAEACEKVSDRNCEYCILPVGDTRSGRLLSFYALLDRFDLNICALAELETESDVGAVRYALVGKRFIESKHPDAPWFLEGFIIEEPKQFSREFFPLVGIFGATPIGFDSMTVSYDDRLQRFYFSLCVPYRNGGALELFLSELYPRYTHIGFYPCVALSHARKELLSL